MIKQACENDAAIIENILLDAVMFLRKAGHENQWNERGVCYGN